MAVGGDLLRGGLVCWARIGVRRRGGCVPVHHDFHRRAHGAPSALEAAVTMRDHGSFSHLPTRNRPGTNDKACSENSPSAASQPCCDAQFPIFPFAAAIFQKRGSFVVLGFLGSWVLGSWVCLIGCKPVR